MIQWTNKISIDDSSEIMQRCVEQQGPGIMEL